MSRTMARGQKGNYRGIIALLDELKELGITTLEFMPLYDFEELIYETSQVVGARGVVQTTVKEAEKINYWGYGPAAYFAPKASYFGGDQVISHAKEMIDEIHGHGMECILEMAFAEGTKQDLMVDALLYWAKEFRVDGFHLVGCNVPIERVAENPYLKRTKIFYDHFTQELLDHEAYGKHLFVYNDDFLYALRRMQNHMEGSMVQFANQMRRQNAHYGFVNYAANSSGFTLWDAYSYGEKHNEENGEENRDGTPVNYSCNYGCEGETRNRSVQKIRMQQMKNAIACVMLGQGVPLILSGDEAANSQNGNNNVYCQDNRTGWVTFSNAKEKKRLREFVKKAIAFRKAHPILSGEEPMHLNDYRRQGLPDLSYHGKEPWAMELRPEQKALGMLYSGAYGEKGEADLYICYNFHYEDLLIALPQLPEEKQWRMVMNTADEAEAWQDEGTVHDTHLTAPGRSVCILVSEEMTRDAGLKTTDANEPAPGRALAEPDRKRAEKE